MKTIAPLALLAVVACGPAAAPEAKAPDDGSGAEAAAVDADADASEGEAEGDAATTDAEPADPGAACIDKAGRRIKPNVISTRIDASQILVQYAGVEGAPASITRTREEACLRAEEALKKMMAGAALPDLVAEYSDEDGAAERKGALGELKKEEAKPDFASAAFVLQPNQVSPVVETTLGFHIIMRTK